MEPDETKGLSPEVPSLNKKSHAIFLRTLSDDHLILHLQHVAEIWFKDSDILAWEEFVRRYKSTKLETYILGGDRP